MTPEEQAERERLIEKIERQRLIKKIEAKRAAEQAPAEPEFDANWKDRAEMLTQGATLNLGDEVYSGLSALGGEIRDVFSDDQGQTLASRFRDKHQALNERREAYRAAHPGEALALELGGGLATGGVGLGRTLAAKGLSTGGRLLRGAGIGAGEGAIAGFGSSAGDLEDRVASGVEGATMGAATAGLMGVGGAGLRTLAKRRVAEDLVDSKGRFTPVTMAESSGVLGDVYRQGVRRIWGAQQRLDDQGQWIMDRGARRLERATALQEGRAGQIEPARWAAADRATALEREFKDIEFGRLDDEATRIQDDYLKAKQMAGADDLNLQRQVEDAVNTDRINFRRQATQNALPDRAGAKFRQKVDAMEPEEARQAIKKWWNANGFSQAKNQPVRWDKSIQDDLQRIVVKEPTFMSSVYDDIVGLQNKAGQDARDAIDATRAAMAAKQKVKVGDIPLEDAAEQWLKTTKTMDGSVFMAIRNNFARNANSASDPWIRTKKRNMVNVFDDRMRDALPEGKRVDFDNEKALYRDYLHYNGAVKRAFNKRGAFDENDWLAVAKQNPDAPSVGAARGLEDTVKARQQGLGQQQAKLAQKVEQAEEAAEQAKAGLKKAREAVRREAEDLKTASKRNDPGLKKAKAAQKRAEKRLAAAQDEMKRLEKLRGPESTSGLSALLTTMTAGGLATLGAVGAGPAAGAAAAVAGVRLGNFLTREGVQKALAGQTRSQEIMADVLRREGLQAIPAGFQRTAGAQAGNEDTLED